MRRWTLFITIAIALLPVSLSAEELLRRYYVHRTIKVVQRASGVFLYTYDETLDPFDPRQLYRTVQRITDPAAVEALRGALAENARYSPDFKARCLPVWDYGIEFRENEKKSRLFLLSTRCNSIKIVEENIVKDFSPQREAFLKVIETALKQQSP